MKKIITRFPPSPTGFLHIGGARTALFNWLYARNMNGTFVLRIEDTDVQRSTKESVDAIFEAMEWLGLDYDKGPFFQSKRLDIYNEYIEKLIDSENAYYCNCSAEKLDIMRKKARQLDGKVKYDGTCRDKGLKKSDSTVIRFRAQTVGTTVLEDVIKGNIVFQNSDMDDFIIQRSDGMPTYNFVVVIDDFTMGINTVLRGDDHVSNTPRQIQLYRALDAPLPVFGHLPMVLGQDKSRLSKRHGAMSVTAYRDMGFMPDALINYLVRLGWSHGDQEFFTKPELIEKFSIKNIGKSAGIFNPEKLLALNADHIKSAPPNEIGNHLLPFLKELKCGAKPGDYLDNVITTLNKRSKDLKEMAQGAQFYFWDEVEYDEKAAIKFLTSSSIELFNQLISGIDSLEALDEKSQEPVFKQIMDTTGLKFGKIAQPLRVALTGSTVSPGIFEVIETLGKERVIKRLRQALEFIDRVHP